MNIGNIERIIEELRKIAQKNNVEKMILFGSRARGDNSPSSDIDLALYPSAETNASMTALEIEDIDTLLKFDICFVDSETDKELIKNIQKDGVIIYEQQ